MGNPVSSPSCRKEKWVQFSLSWALLFSPADPHVQREAGSVQGSAGIWTQLTCHSTVPHGSEWTMVLVLSRGMAGLSSISRYPGYLDKMFRWYFHTSREGQASPDGALEWVSSWSLWFVLWWDPVSLMTVQKQSFHFGGLPLSLLLCLFSHW